MTTLRSFQNEIEEIHNREVSKQRMQSLLEKENKPTKGKLKEETTNASELVNTDKLESHGPKDLEEGILVCAQSQESLSSIIERHHLESPSFRRQY